MSEVDTKAEAEFQRLVDVGAAEAKANDEWLSGTAGIKLTPFALRGLAHSFGRLIDRRVSDAGGADRVEEIARLILSVSSVSYDEANNQRREMAREAAVKVLSTLQMQSSEATVEWVDESLAQHWIDRYAAGIDGEPQMDRILDCVRAKP